MALATPVLAAATLVLMACSGCMAEPPQPSEAWATDPWPVRTNCSPYGTGAQDCYDQIFRVIFENATRLEVLVPFPNGQRCLSGDDWIEGAAASSLTVTSVLTAKGPALKFTGHAPATWTSRIVFPKETGYCPDPDGKGWSTEDNGAVYTYAVEGKDVKLHWRLQAGGCVGGLDRIAALKPITWVAMEKRPASSYCA